MPDRDTEGLRFRFGKNWSEFLRLLDETRIREARRSLQEALDVSSLEGMRFLDAGSGSGLFSLAARGLGAQVHSFDLDPESVSCTAELRRRYFPDDPEWRVEAASVLDETYLRGLGQFDVVYSWGVLHHTGAMWKALEQVVIPVALGGRLYIAIYNDQGGTSRRWKTAKEWYNRLPPSLRMPYAALVMGPRELRLFAAFLLRGEPSGYLRTWTEYDVSRGMSKWHDMIDWIGGYPFEVARPDEIFDFYRARGFELTFLRTVAGGSGCNEYVLLRTPMTAGGVSAMAGAEAS